MWTHVNRSSGRNDGAHCSISLSRRCSSRHLQTGSFDDDVRAQAERGMEAAVRAPHPSPDRAPHGLDGRRRSAGSGGFVVPSAEAAVAYARRQGLQYIVLGSPAHDPQSRIVPSKDAVESPPIGDPPRRRNFERADRTLQPNLMVSSRSAGVRLTKPRPSVLIQLRGSGERQFIAA